MVVIKRPTCQPPTKSNVLKKGTVIKSTGSWYNVRLDDDSVYACRVRGKFRLNGLKLTNPVAVGDEVEFELSKEEEVGLIRKIFSRKNYVVRQSPRQKHHLHLLAANIDQAFVFATIVDPKLKQGFIDRFLLMTEPHDIPTYIIFNKADLLGEKDRMVYEVLADIYKKVGYEVYLISAFQKDSFELLKKILKNKMTLIGGQSGVGKSTLINNLQPQIHIKTAELSGYSGKGQHTTTFAEMYPLDFGGYIIDTPGIKSLSFSNLEPMDVAHNFREFFAFSKHCKFHDCSHRNEPKCAVKEAIENGAISELRYLNYLQILDEIEQQNYWERHKDI